MNAKLSPGLAEIVLSRLVSIVSQAEKVLVRTAYSSTIAEAQDYACAIYDSELRLIGQTRRALGGFVGTMGTGLREVLRVIPPETLQPGDMLLTNDPWMAAGHLPDFLSIMPLFVGDRIVGYTASCGHVSDIGGKPTADATDNFEEGMHIPPCKLYRAGHLNEDIFSLITANSRLPVHVGGDVQALHAANVVMVRRVQEMLSEHGLPDLCAVSDVLQTRASETIRERIRALPDGEYTAETYSDGNGDRLTVAACVTVRGDRLHVDFNGTSPQVRSGINVPFNLRRSALKVR